MICIFCGEHYTDENMEADTVEICADCIDNMGHNEPLEKRLANSKATETPGGSDG